MVYFVGPVHGHEVEGLTGLMNLIEVMETGRDLRGRDQPELRPSGEQCRLLIVPSGNPDGTARFEPRSIQGMPLDEFQFWSMGTWSDDTHRRLARLEAAASRGPAPRSVSWAATSTTPASTRCTTSSSPR